MDVSFQSSGAGINAATIGVPPPDCGSKSTAVLGSDGNWTCSGSAASGSGSASPWLVVLIAGGLWWWFYGRKKGLPGLGGLLR